MARFIAKNKQRASLLDEVLNIGRIDSSRLDLKTQERECRVPFDWSSWVCQLPNFAPSLCRQRSCFRNDDAPISTALSHSQLIRTANTAENFLGSAASFDPQIDEGWGEKHGKSRSVAKVR